MSDDSDYIQAQLLRAAERERIQKVLGPAARNARRARKLSLWACVGIMLVLIPLPLVLTWIL